MVRKSWFARQRDLGDGGVGDSDLAGGSSYLTSLKRGCGVSSRSIVWKSKSTRRPYDVFDDEESEDPTEVACLYFLDGTGESVDMLSSRSRFPEEVASILV